MNPPTGDDMFNPPILPPRRNQQQQIVEVRAPVSVDEDGIAWTGHIGLTPTGLEIPEGVTSQEWEAFYSVIRNIKTSYQFIVGDWFDYGYATFGYTYEQIASWTGYTPKTVETFASVCRNVPRLTRINSLSFAHHRSVASLPQNKQILYLESAEKNGWSARDLHEEITQKKRAKTSGRINVFSKDGLKNARKADPEQRRKIAADLRRIADELEQGGAS